MFGDFPVKVRRLSACNCRSERPEPKSFAALMAMGGIAPELAYVTAKFAALAPFARVADLVSELLPVGGAANPDTVRMFDVVAGDHASSPSESTVATVVLDWFHIGARRRHGEPISTAFVESAINEIVVRRMTEQQQMRWHR